VEVMSVGELLVCVEVTLLLLGRRRWPIRLTQLRDGGDERGQTDLREGALGEDAADKALVTAL
jgi:hypothetical protein